MRVYLKKEKRAFLLHFYRFFVTLAPPKLLALGNEKEKCLFLFHFSRFFVTLPFETLTKGCLTTKGNYWERRSTN